MALFTGRGDKGETGIFRTKKRISKSSAISEALGTLDECNSFLGLCKSKAREHAFVFEKRGVAELVHDMQNNIFTAQAEIAGADKTIPKDSVRLAEDLINSIEKELPPIKSFLISGATELSAWFDFARTLSRRAERRVVFVHEEGRQQIGEHTLSYLNRLSSLLYALARLSNHLADITETPPDYK